MNYEILDISILWEQVNRYFISNGNITVIINVVTKQLFILEKRVLCNPGLYGYMFSKIVRVFPIFCFIYVSNMPRSQHCRGG